MAKKDKHETVHVHKHETTLPVVEKTEVKAEHKHEAHELPALRLGYSLSVLCGAKMLVLSLAAASLGMVRIIGLLQELFLGYELTVLGVIFGVAWAMLDGFVLGFLFAKIYNKMGSCKMAHP